MTKTCKFPVIYYKVNPIFKRWTTFNYYTVSFPAACILTNVCYRTRMGGGNTPWFYTSTGGSKCQRRWRRRWQGPPLSNPYRTGTFRSIVWFVDHAGVNVTFTRDMEQFFSLGNRTDLEIWESPKNFNGFWCYHC